MPFRDFLGAANVAVILLLGVQVPVIAGGLRGGGRRSDNRCPLLRLFSTEPHLRLVITDQHDVITTVLLLVAAIATSELGT